MLKKLFGGIRMTWPCLVIFAVISGLVTGLVALLVPDGSSFRQIAVTFEAWIVLAIIVVVNCEKPLEAAFKTFVYFLISQPLVYLVQVPFSSMGFRLFGYYYPYWFWWTVATFPGGFIAWYIKRDNWLAALVLSVALAGLVFLGAGYLKSLITNPPKYLVATLFCFGSVPLLIIAILHKRNPRLIATGISVLALAVSIFLMVRNVSFSYAYEVKIGLDEKEYPVTEGWTAALEDPDNGTVTLTPPYDIFVKIKDINKPTGIILTDPDGKQYILPLKIEKTADGTKIDY